MTLFPELPQTTRLFLRRIGFVSVCLALLTQTVFLNGAVQSVAAEEKAKTATRKKRTKKAKTVRSINPAMLPPGLLTLTPSQVVADEPRVSPAAPIGAKRTA